VKINVVRTRRASSADPDVRHGDQITLRNAAQ
jgi:hypothetical protein